MTESQNVYRQSVRGCYAGEPAIAKAALLWRPVVRREDCREEPLNITAPERVEKGGGKREKESVRE